MTPDDLSTSLANCLICTPAESMRECPRCAFYPALPFKALQGIKAGQDYPPEFLAARREGFIKAIKAQNSKSNQGLTAS